jgi:hypothetical protein
MAGKHQGGHQVQRDELPLNDLKANAMSAKWMRPWAKSAKLSQAICQLCHEGKQVEVIIPVIIPWKKRAFQT